MAHRGATRAAAIAALMAITTIVPAAAAGADLLGGTTDEVVDTVDSSGSLVDGTVDDTGTVLDEPVDEVTTVVDETSLDLTGPVDSTTDPIIGTVDSTTDPIIDTVDDPLPADSSDAPRSPTTSTTTSTTFPVSSDSPGDEAVDLDSLDLGETGDTEDEVAVVAPLGGDPSEPGGFDTELTVLSAAGGVSDLGTLETVSLSAITDETLYGRLLSWLTGAGAGILGILAGPLLALEILFRALLSAGSGLVAPASLLASYLLRLVWEARPRISSIAV